MLEQFAYIALDCLQLIELEIWIDNREQIARPELLVDEDTLAVPVELFFNFEEPLAFEHDRKNISRGNKMRIVQLDDFAQKGFGRFPLNRIESRSRGFINSLPVRDEAFAIARSVAELFLPAGLADIEAAKRCFFVEQQRMIVFLVVKGPAARFARVGS